MVLSILTRRSSDFDLQEDMVGSILPLVRTLGDLLHVSAMVLLIASLHLKGKCLHISSRTQVAYALVYMARFIPDMATEHNMYRASFKVFLVVASLYTVFLMRLRYRSTLSRHDVIPTIALALPAAIVALRFQYKKYGPKGWFGDLVNSETAWAFSIYLEAIAMVPQIVLLVRIEDDDVAGSDGGLSDWFLVITALYRTAYIPNWIYRYTKQNHVDPISVAGGVVQTLFGIAVVVLVRLEARRRALQAAAVLPSEAEVLLLNEATDEVAIILKN